MLFGAALGQYMWTVVDGRRAPPRRRAGRRRRAARAEEAAACVTSSASAACGGRARTSRSATTSSSSAAARTGSRPPTTSSSAASPTSPCSRRATSARARPAATRRSCARTTRRPRARASTTPRSSSTRACRPELDFNLLFSQCGHLTLAHTDRAMFVMANRAEVNRLHGIDSRLIGPEEVQRLAPAMYVVRRRHASDHGRALPPAGRDHPPRRGRLGLRPRRRRRRRGDPSLHRGHRARARQRARDRACRPTAAASRPARWSTPRRAGAR